MTKPTLDELIVPAPPYRMVRPVASLTMASGEFRNDALARQLEGVGVSRVEKKLGGSDAYSEQDAERNRDARQSSMSRTKDRPETADEWEREAGAHMDAVDDLARRVREAGVVEVSKAESPEGSSKQAVERADAAEKIRDTALEATDSVLAERGTELSVAASAVREAAATVPAPVETAPKPEVGSETVYIKPEAPSGKYEMPADAKSEMDRIIAKQAELRAAGKEEEAKQWDVALSKYREFRKGDKAKFYVEKKKAEAERPVAAEKPADAAAVETPKRIDSLEAERASVAAAIGMPEAKRAALLKEYDDAIAKRDAASSDSGSGENTGSPEAAPAVAPEVGSETIYVKPGESPDKAPVVAAPVVETPQEPAGSEVAPAESKKVLGTLEEERAAVAAAQGMSEEKRASLLKEYDEAIAKRDGSPEAVEKKKVAPTAAELEAYQQELKEKAAAAERAEQESRGGEMAAQAEAADKAQKAAIVEDFERGRAKVLAEAERAEQEKRGEDMWRDTRAYQELDRLNELRSMHPDDVPDVSPEDKKWYEDNLVSKKGIHDQSPTPAEQARYQRIHLQVQRIGQREYEKRVEQEARGTEMAAETDAKLRKAAETKLPTPDRVAKIRQARDHVVARPESGSWLKTMLDRNHAWQARALAVEQGSLQAKTQAKLDFAQTKIAEYETKLANAGPIGRLWYANRLDKWQSKSMKFEATVARHNAQREALVERHASYVRSVAERYERELTPYREVVKDLSERLAVQASVREKLHERRAEALIQLSKAEVAAKRGRWFKEPAAAQAMKEIREQLSEIERRINGVDSKSREYRSVLTRAELKVKVLDDKKNAVTEKLKYPEFAAQKLPEHEPLPITPPAETTPAVPESDPSDHEWKPDDLVKQWNALGLQPIDDPASFKEYINAETRRLNLRGTPKAKDLKPMLLKYLEVASMQKPKILESDWKQFLRKAKPTP